MAYIEVRDLVREYRSHRHFPGAWGALRSLVTRQADVRRALDGVSFTIERGEAVGYVGPNGAGKSSTVKILTGVLVPTAGEARVGGRVPHRERREHARRMGVVFGQRSQLWWDLPLRDSFELHRHVYRVPAARYRQNLDFCADLLGVGEHLDRPVRQLSLGQRMRAELALALLHDPEVLFLDEPTIGLDVVVKDRVRACLREAVRARGVTLLLTSHDLRDLETLCPRLLVLDRGRLVWDGPVAGLRARYGRERRLTVEFEADPGPVALPADPAAFAGVELVEDAGRRKTYRFDRGAVGAPALLAALGRAAPVPLADAAVADADIEGVIRALYADLTGPGQGHPGPPGPLAGTRAPGRPGAAAAAASAP
jgi:ABC-2 type transport system ATP-binding protein